MATNQSIEQSAYHEAGHAVVARASGVDVRDLYVWHEKGSAGWLDEWWGNTVIGRDITDEVNRAIAVAGFLAEALYLSLADVEDIVYPRLHESFGELAKALLGREPGDNLTVSVSVQTGDQIRTIGLEVFSEDLDRLFAGAAHRPQDDIEAALQTAGVRLNTSWPIVIKVAKHLIEGKLTERRTLIKPIFDYLTEGLSNDSHKPRNAS